MGLHVGFSDHSCCAQLQVAASIVGTVQKQPAGSSCGLPAPSRVVLPSSPTSVGLEVDEPAVAHHLDTVGPGGQPAVRPRRRADDRWADRAEAAAPSPGPWPLGFVPKNTVLCNLPLPLPAGFGGQTVSVSVFMEEAFGYTFGESASEPA